MSNLFGKYISTTYPELLRTGNPLTGTTVGISTFSIVDAATTELHTLLDGNGDKVGGIVIDTNSQSFGGIMFRNDIDSGGIWGIKTNQRGSNNTIGLEFYRNISSETFSSRMFLTNTGRLYVGWGELGNAPISDIGTYTTSIDSAVRLYVNRGIMLRSSTDQTAIGMLYMESSSGALILQTGSTTGEGGNVFVRTLNTTKHIYLTPNTTDGKVQIITGEYGSNGGVYIIGSLTSAQRAYLEMRPGNTNGGSRIELYATTTQTTPSLRLDAYLTHGLISSGGSSGIYVISSNFLEMQSRDKITLRHGLYESGGGVFITGVDDLGTGVSKAYLEMRPGNTNGSLFRSYQNNTTTTSSLDIETNSSESLIHFRHSTRNVLKGSPQLQIHNEVRMLRYNQRMGLSSISTQPANPFDFVLEDSNSDWMVDDTWRGLSNKVDFDRIITYSAKLQTNNTGGVLLSLEFAIGRSLSLEGQTVSDYVLSSNFDSTEVGGSTLHSTKRGDETTLTAIGGGTFFVPADHYVFIRRSRVNGMDLDGSEADPAWSLRIWGQEWRIGL